MLHPDPLLEPPPDSLMKLRAPEQQRASIVQTPQLLVAERTRLTLTHYFLIPQYPLYYKSIYNAAEVHSSHATSSQPNRSLCFELTLNQITVPIT